MDRAYETSPTLPQDVPTQIRGLQSFSSVRAMDLNLRRLRGPCPLPIPSKGEVSCFPGEVVACVTCIVLWALLKSKVCCRIKERRELFCLQRLEMNQDLKQIYFVQRHV